VGASSKSTPRQNKRKINTHTKINKHIHSQVSLNPAEIPERSAVVLGLTHPEQGRKSDGVEVVILKRGKHVWCTPNMSEIVHMVPLPHPASWPPMVKNVACSTVV
jgi:hypothetical protein